MVSCGRDGTAKLWDCGTQSCIRTIDNVGGNVNSCSLGVPGSDVDVGTADCAPGKASAAKYSNGFWGFYVHC